MMKSAKSVSRMQRRSQSKWETTKIKFPTLSASHWDDAEDLLPGLVMAFGKQRALLGELDAVADSATATPTTLPPLPPAGASSSTPAAEASESDSHRASEPSGKGQKRKSTCISPSSRSNSPFNPKIPRTESASIECACQEDASECHAIGCRNKSVAPRFGALPHQAVTEQALLVNASPKETPRKLHSMAKSMAKLPPQQGRKAERVSRDVLSKLSSPLPSPSSRLPRSYAIEAIEDHRVLAKRGGHSNGDRVHEFLVKWEGYAERSWVKADCFDRYGDMFRAACKRFGVCLWPTTALCKSAVARHVDLNLNSLTSADDKSFASQLQVCCHSSLTCNVTQYLRSYPRICVCLAHGRSCCATHCPSRHLGGKNCARTAITRAYYCASIVRPLLLASRIDDWTMTSFTLKTSLSCAASKADPRFAI